MRGSVPDAARAELAIGPTTLAQPPPHTGPAGLRTSVASLVGASFGSVLKAAPSWLTPRIAGLIAVAIAGVVLSAVIVVSATDHKPHGPAAASASAPLFVLPPRPPDPKLDDILASAQAKIDKGDFASAIDELTPAEKKEPRRPEVHALLERAYTSVHNTHEALREASLWLASDPNAAVDMKLEEDVRNAALLHDGQEDAFAILESKMGPRGIDLLYDIAYGSSGRQYPQAAARAKHSLEVDEVRRRASSALAVVLAFRETKTCEQKHALLGDARDKGDIRMYALLQPYEVTKGCGFFGRSDCYPCMRKDHDLADALQALQDRATKPQ
jgi:serine/threonine-protein kinase